MTATVTHGVTATHVAVVVTYMFHMYVTITHDCYRTYVAFTISHMAAQKEITSGPDQTSHFVFKTFCVLSKLTWLLP